MVQHTWVMKFIIQFGIVWRGFGVPMSRIGRDGELNNQIILELCTARASCILLYLFRDLRSEVGLLQMWE